MAIDNNRTQLFQAEGIDMPELSQQESLLQHEEPAVDLYPESGRRQPSRLQQILQQLTKRKIKTFVYHWRWRLFFVFLFAIYGALMARYYREILQGLERLSHALADMGYSGYAVMGALVFLSAFPPILGYATYQTLCGFTFGFEIGFPISYLSALLGAIVCFQLSRTCLKARVTRTLAKYPHLEAVVKAVEKKGFKLFLLIRFSPYPFNLLNVLFAATEISLFHFAAGTAISLLKVALHVYIGANLTSFAKHVLGEDEDLSEDELKMMKFKYAVMIFFSVLAFGVMFYLYRVAKTAVKEVSLVDEEQMAFLNHHDEEEGFLDNEEEEEDDDDDQTKVNSAPSVTHTPPNQNAPKHEIESQSRDSMSLDAWDAWGDEDDESHDEEEYTFNKPIAKKAVIGKDD